MGSEAGAPPASETRAVRGLVFVGRWAGLATAGSGALVLFGWLVGSELLTRLDPALASMKANTAICFCLLGSSLALAERARNEDRRVRDLLALAAVLIAGVTFAQCVFGFDAGIDQLLFEDRTTAAFPGRMSPATSVNFLMLGGAVLALDRFQGTRLRVAEVFALLGAFSAFLSLLGYAYGTEALYSVGPYSSIALHTTITFGILACGVLCVRRDHACVRLLSKPGPAGVLVRRLVPAALLLPAMLGWLRIYGQKAGLYGTEFGATVLVASCVLCFVVLGAWTARVLGQAERVRRTGEARRAAVFEAALDAVVTMNHEGRVTDFNAAAESMFGYAREEAIGAMLAELIIPERLRDRHQAGLSRFVNTGVSSILGKRLELPAMRADGSEFSVELGVVSVPSDGPPEFTGYIRDLSKLKRAEEARRAESTARSRAEEALRQTEEQLRQSQKLESVGRLAGGVAHDFNNMLTVILGCADLLLDGLAEGDPNRGEVKEIRLAADRAAELTRQLLAFSRQQVLEPKVVDLNELLRNLDRMLARVIGENIELRIVTAKELGRSRVDPHQIELVIMNLVVNARDAMPNGGKLTLETSNVEFTEAHVADHVGASLGPHVMVAVTDTGVGMDAETKARIFEPFFTTKPIDKGTGLGLAMVFGTVTQSGGHVWVYSEPGQGTTFKLYFPRTDEPTSARPAADVSPSTSLRGTEAVLLVEDQEHVRRVCSTILRRNGYSVFEATSAEEALAFSEKHEGKIDLLLTDVVMPGMSGADLAEHLARARPGLRLLCMSGYADEAVFGHGHLKPGISFLQKPITPEILARRVREVLDLKESPEA